MKRSINGFRFNKNGKPIIKESGEVKHDHFKGDSYKKDGIYYFFKRIQNKMYIYEQ